MDVSFDTLYWDLTGAELSPRNPPKAINYPAAGHVRTPDIFGFNNQFSGTEVLPAIGDVRSGVGYGTGGIEFFGTITGNFITPAKVAAEDNRDGSHATFTVWNTPHATAVNAVYVAQFLSSGPQSWALVGTVVGNGSFIAALASVEYQVKVQTTYSGGVGVYIGNTFWISNVASRRRALLRDRTAFAAMRVAHRLGRKIWVRNLGYTAVEVWCTCEGGFESLSLLGGETSATRFTLWIPRQTGMPMAEGFKPGMTCWVEDIPFACQITYDAELPLWAPVFRADCTRYDITVELDGLEVPTHGP